MLEYHADIFAHFIDISMLIRHIDAVHDNGTGGDGFELVHAAQKGRFSAAGGTEQHDNFALRDINADILEHFQLSKIFFQISDLYFLITAVHVSASFPHVLQPCSG